MADHTLPKTEPRTLLNPKDLEHLYVEGELPEYRVAQILDTSRYLVARNLVWHGITRRTSGEATVLRFQNNPTERQRAATHARGFFTGRTQSVEQRVKIANTVYKNQKNVSWYEQEVSKAMYDAGVQVETLWPLDRWNIDIAIPHIRLAVEIHGGWHDSAVKRDQDTRKAAYLTEQGWTLLVFNRSSFYSKDRPTPSEFVAMIVRGTLTAYHDITSDQVTSKDP